MPIQSLIEPCGDCLVGGHMNKHAHEHAKTKHRHAAIGLVLGGYFGSLVPTLPHDAHSAAEESAAHEAAETAAEEAAEQAAERASGRS
jgi:hypothetical protein